MSDRPLVKLTHIAAPSLAKTNSNWASGTNELHRQLLPHLALRSHKDMLNMSCCSLQGPEQLMQHMTPPQIMILNAGLSFLTGVAEHLPDYLTT